MREPYCAKCDMRVCAPGSSMCTDCGRIDALESYLRDLLADIDHKWETQGQGVRDLWRIEYQFSRGETEELRKLIGGKP